MSTDTLNELDLDSPNGRSERCGSDLSGRTSNASRKSANRRVARALQVERKKVTDVLVQSGDGSMMRGWRREFDPQGNLEIDFEDFCVAARRLSLVVDSTLLFNCDGDAAFLTLEEVDETAGQLFGELREWIHDKFGSTRTMFHTLCAARGSGVAKLNRQDWIAALAKFGFPASEQECGEIYDCCDYAEVGFIQQDDVIFLEHDPKVRAREAFKVKACNLDRWKTVAAQEYMTNMRKNKALLSAGQKPPRGRDAPRVWLDRTYECLPAVASFVKHDRAVTEHRNALAARQAFREHLVQTHGNEVRGFRKGIAIEGMYTFTFSNLRRYLNRHNSHIDGWALWRGLDRDGDGKVTMEEMCLEHALALASLKRWAAMTPRLGKCAKIWRSEAAAEVSREKSGAWFSDSKMLRALFCETLKRLGMPGASDKAHVKLICEALDYHGCGVITLQDLEWLDRWRPPEWTYASPDPNAWAQMKALLVKRYGHPLIAWRRALDRDDSNVVTWEEFQTAAKRIGFPHYAAAWRALDQDASQSIGMMEYDPESAELLKSFRRWAIVHFGSIRRCFSVLDGDGNGSVSLAELKRACHKMAWEGDVRLLFDFLDVDGAAGGVSDARRSISYAELSFLDSWTADPTEEELASKGELQDAEQKAAQRKQARGAAARVAAITSRLVTPVEFTLARYRSSEYLSKPPEWLRSGSPTRAAAPTAQLPAVASCPGLGPRRGAGAPTFQAPAAASRGAAAVAAPPDGWPSKARVRAPAGMTPPRPPGGRGGGGGQVDDRVIDAIIQMGRTW